MLTGALLFLGLLGVSAVRQAGISISEYNNVNVVDDEVIRRNRKSQPIVHGEVCREKSITDQYGNSHTQYIGVRSGCVHLDTWWKELRDIESKNAQRKAKAIAEGKKTYQKYDYRWRKDLDTEIETDKSIACLEHNTDLDLYRVYYIDENYHCLGEPVSGDYSSMVYPMSRMFPDETGDYGRIISKETYDGLIESHGFRYTYTYDTYRNDHRDELWTEKDPVYYGYIGLECEKEDE